MTLILKKKFLFSNLEQEIFNLQLYKAIFFIHQTNLFRSNPLRFEYNEWIRIEELKWMHSLQYKVLSNIMSYLLSSAFQHHSFFCFYG